MEHEKYLEYHKYHMQRVEVMKKIQDMNQAIEKLQPGGTLPSFIKIYLGQEALTFQTIPLTEKTLKLVREIVNATHSNLIAELVRLETLMEKL